MKMHVNGVKCICVCSLVQWLFIGVLGQTNSNSTDSIDSIGQHNTTTNARVISNQSLSHSSSSSTISNGSASTSPTLHTPLLIINTTVTENYTLVTNSIPNRKATKLSVPVEFIIGICAAGIAIISVIVIIIVCWRKQKTVLLPERSVYDTQDTAWDNLSLNYIDNPNELSKDSWDDVSEDSAYLASLDEIINQRSSAVIYHNSGHAPVPNGHTVSPTVPLSVSSFITHDVQICNGDNYGTVAI